MNPIREQLERAFGQSFVIESKRIIKSGPKKGRVMVKERRCDTILQQIEEESRVRQSVHQQLKTATAADVHNLCQQYDRLAPEEKSPFTGELIITDRAYELLAQILAPNK